MRRCINCGMSTLSRTKDTFHCLSCGYVWDVAHEHANAAYLRTQGQRPAAPADEDAVPSSTDTAHVTLDDLSRPVPLEKEGAPADEDQLVGWLETQPLDELTAIARQLDLPGRSKLNKDELIVALAAEFSEDAIVKALVDVTREEDSA